MLSRKHRCNRSSPEPGMRKYQAFSRDAQYTRTLIKILFLMALEFSPSVVYRLPALRNPQTSPLDLGQWATVGLIRWWHQETLPKMNLIIKPCRFRGENSIQSNLRPDHRDDMVVYLFFIEAALGMWNSFLLHNHCCRSADLTIYSSVFPYSGLGVGSCCSTFVIAVLRPRHVYS